MGWLHYQPGKMDSDKPYHDSAVQKERQRCVGVTVASMSFSALGICEYPVCSAQYTRQRQTKSGHEREAQHQLGVSGKTRESRSARTRKACHTCVRYLRATDSELHLLCCTEIHTNEYICVVSLRDDDLAAGRHTYFLDSHFR